MKILYDISILGLGYSDIRFRKGIFRVIENVAEHLVAESELQMKFTCSFDDETLDKCANYLAANPKLARSSISIPPLFYRKFYTKNKRKELVTEVYSDNGDKIIKKVSQKLLIRSLLFQERVYKYFSQDLINARDLRESDIYHASYYPIPEQVRKAKPKSVFINAYDLIPVLAPQYVTPDHVEFFKTILNTITPETWVLCISADCRNDLLNYMGNRVNPARVRVIELAASDNFFPSTDTERNRMVREKFKIPEGQYMLSLCTFEPRKNIESVIKAFARLITQENVPDLNLVLVGGKGWMFDNIFKELDMNKAVQDRIIITGFVEDEYLAPLYTGALLFVYPSFYEGFGLPPLEAMQCGTPVITSNVTSLPEVVGDAGIMVPPTDLDALCEAMLSIYNNLSLREKLKAKSLERAKKFSWERCASETAAAYKASLL